MNRKELKEKLDALEVNPSLYSLDGTLYSDTIVLYHNYSKWEVFYFERGNRSDEKIFSSEDEACDYIYNKFKEDKEKGYL